MPLLEKDVENKVVRYAKEQGCLVRKMNGLGARNWPDRLFVSPSGRIWFCEFKAPGKRVDKDSAQGLFIHELQVRKVTCYEVNDVARGLAMVDAECSR